MSAGDYWATVRARQDAEAARMRAVQQAGPFPATTPTLGAPLPKQAPWPQGR
jgi:hypothetical protein